MVAKKKRRPIENIPLSMKENIGEKLTRKKVTVFYRTIKRNTGIVHFVDSMDTKNLIVQKYKKRYIFALSVRSTVIGLLLAPTKEEFINIVLNVE